MTHRAMTLTAREAALEAALGALLVQAEAAGKVLAVHDPAPGLTFQAMTHLFRTIGSAERVLDHGATAAEVGALADMATQRDFRPLWPRLLAYWTEEDARLWLASPQPLLDGAVPAELLAKGQGARLHGLMDTLDSGAYL